MHCSTCRAAAPEGSRGRSFRNVHGGEWKCLVGRVTRLLGHGAAEQKRSESGGEIDIDVIWDMLSEGLYLRNRY